jgi:hypothetical protein
VRRQLLAWRWILEFIVLKPDKCRVIPDTQENIPRLYVYRLEVRAHNRE